MEVAFLWSWNCIFRLGMAYRLRKNENVTDGLRRIIDEELRAAVSQLSTRTRDTAIPIHEARKHIKMARAAWRLVSAKAGAPSAAQRDLLRVAGRRLSTLRDADAMLETLDDLGGRSDREYYFTQIRNVLVAKRNEQNGKRRIMKQAATDLSVAARKLPRFENRADGFGALAPGLEKTFRRGRTALRKVQERPTDENFHELRKRVKDHWYHMRLLGNAGDASLTKYEKRLKRLGNWLGDDHNLAVLREKIGSDPAFETGPHQIADIRALIDKQQQKLREKALSAAREIYKEKPRNLADWLSERWQHWQG